MTENQNSEYKRSWRDEYFKWICGFANAQGGILDIGKDDHGVVVGLPDAEKLLEELPNKIRDLLGIVANVDLLTEGGKTYIRITVEPYPYPISYKGEYHYRSGSTKQVLKGAALDRFLLGRLGKHWDGVPVPYVALPDLDHRILAGFRKRASRSHRLSAEVLDEPDAALVDKLRLVEGNYLKRAAVLLFHPEPERFVSGAFIKIGYFRTNSELLYHDEIHGDLFTQVDNVMGLLLTKYLKAIISYEGIQRVETYPVPEEALREAVLNAIAHKDYGSGIPIQISVYDDRVMLWNPGQLPPDWTVERLTGKHSSQPFNPDVAGAFFRAGMIEAWGRGIERIIDACRMATTPVPVFRYEQTGLWVEFAFGGASMPDQQTARRTREKTRGKTREKIIASIAADSLITIEELADQIGITAKGIEWQINKLKQEGRLKRVGSAKGGHWQVNK